MTSLRERIDVALRTTPATGHTHKAGQEKWDHHPRPGEKGHTYTYICALCRQDTEALTNALETVLADEVEAEQARRQVALRTCLFPGCIKQYDAISHMDGREPPRPEWSGAGWHILKTNSVFTDGGHLCPAHVPIVTTHLPKLVKTLSGRYTVDCACGWMPPAQRWHRVAAVLWQEHLLTANGDLPAAPPLTDPEHRIPLAEHTDATLDELYDRLWDAEGELVDRRDAGQALFRSWNEQRTLLTDGASLAAGVHNTLLVLRSRMKTDSRDWAANQADAWLYAVLIGWDCEQQHDHTDDCAQLLEEVAAKHSWSAERVARIRKFRATLAKAGPNGETDAAAARAVEEN
ncbi:hypothetical protein [Streptomyces sp. NPDC047981]|uniref:hypothetical protein n=1 Tax=Streptomyces sp. NPDC047981 TaxID=3154610 RepID=UPI0034242A5E